MELDNNLHNQEELDIRTYTEGIGEGTRMIFEVLHGKYDPSLATIEAVLEEVEDEEEEDENGYPKTYNVLKFYFFDSDIEILPKEIQFWRYVKTM